MRTVNEADSFYVAKRRKCVHYLKSQKKTTKKTINFLVSTKLLLIRAIETEYNRRGTHQKLGMWYVICIAAYSLCSFIKLNHHQQKLKTKINFIYSLVRLAVIMVLN